MPKPRRRPPSPPLMRFIETEEREDIYTALCGLLEELPKGALERQALLDVFEEERDF